MKSAALVGLVVLFASSGCATMAVAPASVTGTFQGPSILGMEVTSPISRRLPDENGQGVATLSDAGGGTAMLSVQLRANGQRCTLAGQLSGSRFVVQPGQRCTAAVEYDDIPFDAQVEVTQGYADINGSAISVSLGGPVAATSLNTGRNFEGVALWRMQGAR